MMGIVQVGGSQSHLDRSRPEIRGWFQRQPGWSLFSLGKRYTSRSHSPLAGAGLGTVRFTGGSTLT